MFTALRLICVVVISAVTSAVIYAIANSGTDRWAPVGDIILHPVVVATIIDVYAGIAFVGAWVWSREFSAKKSIAWILFFIVSGNIGVGIYMLKTMYQSNGDPVVFFLGQRTVHRVDQQIQSSNFQALF
jgi:hypothetical protein